MDNHLEDAAWPSTEDTLGESSQSDGRIWQPEMAWLCSRPEHDAARQRMRDALADAIMLLPIRAVERIAALAEDEDRGAAFRLTARLVRATDRMGWQKCRDLAACALLLAVLECRDERAAVELAVLVSLRGENAATNGLRESFSYPAPLDRPVRIAERMRRRGRIALDLLANGTGWGRAVTDLGRLADGDPLGDLDASGQPRVGWAR